MDFSNLVEDQAFIDEILTVIAVFDEPYGEDASDLEHAIEITFLHSEKYEQFFIDLNEIDTLKFKLFVADCVVSELTNQRWYP